MSTMKPDNTIPKGAQPRRASLSEGNAEIVKPHKREDFMAMLANTGVELGAVTTFDSSRILQVDSEMLTKMGERMPRLTSVNLCNQMHVTSAGLRALVEGCTKELGCLGLRELNISRCMKVNDVAIKAVVDKCPEIHNVQACSTSLTDMAGRLLSKCSQLATLNLASTKVTDEGITLVADACPKLSTLDISYCAVGDTGALAIANGCPEMQHLAVKNTSVGEAGLLAFAEKCTKLVHLDASNIGVSDAAFKALMSNCQQLRYLDVSVCACSSGIHQRGGHPGQWDGWCRESCCNMVWHLGECPIDEMPERMRTITDASFEGLSLADRPERVNVLRIAGSRITNKTLEGLMAGYTEHGLTALPEMIDILNCTELTDDGIKPLMVVDAEQRVLAKMEQRATDFALTGLRLQEVEYELLAGEESKKLWARNGIRRTTFGENDGMYIYMSSLRFASKAVQAEEGVGEGNEDAFKWSILNKFDEDVVKVLAVEQPYREMDEKTKRKKVKRGFVKVHPAGKGEVTLELRWGRDGATVGNCTRDEGINIRIVVTDEKSRGT